MTKQKMIIMSALAKESKAVPSEGRRPHIDRFKNLKYLLENNLLNHNKIFVDTTKVKPSGNEYNFVDLFSGAGGNTLGLNWAGFNPILSVEIDHDASETYRNNFPKVPHFERPIENLSDEKIKSTIERQEVHLITAGFPCQGFSSAGLRNPDDERNVLYKQVVRIAKGIKPWFLVLENVPGLVTMQNGAVFKAIIKDFERIGYPRMSVALLESASYGVPQIRPRVIFIANRLGLKNPYPRPILKPENYVSIESAIKDLENVPMTPDINHEWTKHSKEMELRISMVPPGGSLYKSYIDAWKRQYKGVPSMTIKENHGGTHIHYKLNRVLSAREMARLQSFPDSFVFSSRMKRVMWQVGNAAPPLLFKHIGLALIPTLNQIKQSRIS